MDIDRLNSVSRVNTAKVCMRLLDRLQDFPKNEQVAAVATLFVILSRELSISPQRLSDTALNITQFETMFQDEQDKVFDAVAAYVRGELK